MRLTYQSFLLIYWDVLNNNKSIIRKDKIKKFYLLDLYKTCTWRDKKL